MSVRSIKSAERTLALFELFSAMERGLTVSEVSRGLGMPQPSATMLLQYLTQLGYLEHDRASRSFAPTVRVVLLGDWMRRKVGATSIAQRLTELQAHCTGAIAFAAIRNGHTMQVVLSLEPGAESLTLRTSASQPIIRHAAGRALLIDVPASERQLILRRCNAEAEPDGRTVEAEFMAAVADAADKGYVYLEDDPEPGLASLAVPLTAQWQGLPLAVGLYGPPDRIAGCTEGVAGHIRRLAAGLR